MTAETRILGHLCTFGERVFEESGLRYTDFSMIVSSFWLAAERVAFRGEPVDTVSIFDETKKTTPAASLGFLADCVEASLDGTLKADARAVLLAAVAAKRITPESFQERWV